MTYEQALEVVIIAARTTLARLTNECTDGPEGIEVHLEPMINKITIALQIVEHGEERESNP